MFISSSLKVLDFSFILTLIIALIYWICFSLNDAADNAMRMLVKVTNCLQYVNKGKLKSATERNSKVSVVCLVISKANAESTTAQTHKDLACFLRKVVFVFNCL